MKFYALLAGVMLMAACNNNKDKVVIEDKETGTKTTLDVSKAEKFSQDFTKKVEELQKLTPYTLDEMKALLPETFAGANRSNMNVASAMGTSVAEADYEINDTTSVTLKIFDCAGEAGAGIYSMQFLGMMNLQQETEDEITRTIDFNGTKAVEQFEKDGSRASFVWVAKERLLVTLEGENTRIEPLRQLAGSLKF